MTDNIVLGNPSLACELPNVSVFATRKPQLPAGRRFWLRHGTNMISF